ncbi:GNAT family N-acetyltransferase [Arcanobacterium haemolyticum]|nr:GNAT family N-acetyltransferase [Arcanobacterium haemolyticum]
MIRIVENDDDIRACFDIRLEVFVEEQHVPIDEEIDAHDSDSSTIHVLADVDGEAAGTLRVLPEGPGHCHIGRVALRKVARGTGLGRKIMDYAAEVALERCCDDTGTVVIELSAQVQAIGFYEACGYELIPGEPYLDAGIPHRDMKLVISQTA